MRERKAPIGGHAVSVAHRVFVAGASMVVWLTHDRVLRGAGYGFFSFLRACDAQYAF